MAGKIFTMVYALIGMPLFLLYLANIGDILAKAFKWTYSTCCQMRQRRQQRKSVARQAHFRTEVEEGDDQQVLEIPYLEQVEGAELDGDSRVQTRMITHVVEEEEEEVESDDDDVKDIPAMSKSSSSSSSSDNKIVMIRRRRCSEDEVSDSCEYSEEGDERQVVVVVSGEDFISTSRSGGDFISTSRSGSSSSGSSGSSSSDEPKESLMHLTVPVTLSLVVMVSYIILGAFLFAAWEGWSVLDGFYFCFVTLSTIGFGDFVPGSSFDKAGGGDGDDELLVNPQFVFCTIYILLGMAVIAMCFNLMQEKVVQNITSFGKKLGIIDDD